MPYTALHFQDDAATHQHATLSRYVKHLALPMGITHMLVFSQSNNKKKKEEEEKTEEEEKAKADAGTTTIPPSLNNTTTSSHLNLRLVKTPQGPTLWFRVHQFSLNRHVQAIQKRPYQLSAELNQHPPIVVTNNFGSSGGAGGVATTADSVANTPPHIKLMRITFQNMFPAINVATVALSSCRRVVLFHLVEEDDEQKNDNGTATTTTSNDPTNKPKKKRQLVQVRHYAIKTSTPKAVQNRRVQRLLHPSKSFPNLHHVQDIADYIVGQSQHGGGGSIASDSEVSDDEDQVEVVLPGSGSHLPGRKKSKKQPTPSSDAASTGSTATSSTSISQSGARSAVLKLVELGPRLTLELIKVEKGLESSGSVVLYHAHIQKRPEEVQALQKRHEQQVQLKRQRQAIQQANVERKQQLKQQQQQQQQQQVEAKKMKTPKALQQEKGDGNSDVDDEEQEDAEDFDDEQEANGEWEGDVEGVNDEDDLEQ